MKFPAILITVLALAGCERQCMTSMDPEPLRQINTLRAQNQKLLAARDLLLPRLMRGEIVV